jgi:hypothetical protein
MFPKEDIEMDKNTVAIDAPARIPITSRQKILLVWAVILITVALGVIVWRLIEYQGIIVRLNDELVQARYQITSLERDLTFLDNDITSLRGAVASDIRSLNSEISGLSSYLNSVAALAENANRYAHSHPYSDSRLKFDLTPIDDPLEKLLAVQGGYFTWNHSAKEFYHPGREREIGVLAQDVEVVFPELVYTDPNGYKQVDYARLTAVLVEAIRQQQIEIENLDLRLSAMD